MTSAANDEPAQKPRRALYALGIVIALGGALLPIGRWGKAYSGLGPLLGGEVLWWLLLAVILAYVLLVERLSLTSLGFRRPTIWTVVLGVLAGVLLTAGIVFIYFTVFPLLHLTMNAGQMAALLHTPYWYRVLLVTRAAFCEEILFRGYPMSRFRMLTASNVPGAVITWAAFTVAHLSSWGAAQLIVAGFGGVVLTALYLWRRDLSCNIIAHWVGDGAGFLLR